MNERTTPALEWFLFAFEQKQILFPNNHTIAWSDSMFENDYEVFAKRTNASVSERTY